MSESSGYDLRTLCVLWFLYRLTSGLILHYDEVLGLR